MRATQHLGINYSNVPVRKLDEGAFDVRLDHNFSSKDTAFARFSYDQATNFVPGGSPGFAEPSNFASSQNITNHGRNVALAETHIFSDRTINQISGGFNRIFNHIASFGDRTCTAAKIGIAGANLDSSCPGAPAGLSQSSTDCVSCGLTSTQMFGGYWSLGDRGFAPFVGGTNVFHISDSLRHHSWPPQHPGRRTGPRPADECSDQRFPGRFPVDVWGIYRRRYALTSFWDRSAARSMIRPSRVLPPVAAGSCSGPTCRTTGGSPTTSPSTWD